MIVACCEGCEAAPSSGVPHVARCVCMRDLCPDASLAWLGLRIAFSRVHHLIVRSVSNKILFSLCLSYSFCSLSLLWLSRSGVEGDPPRTWRQNETKHATRRGGVVVVVDNVVLNTSLTFCTIHQVAYAARRCRPLIWGACPSPGQPRRAPPPTRAQARPPYQQRRQQRPVQPCPPHAWASS